METNILEGQSLLDLAIQEGGAVETVISIAVNNDINVTGVLSAQDNIITPTPQNKQVHNYYMAKGLTPATDTGMEVFAPIGIGYMTINENFIIA